jgi:hypothetical protein
VNARTVFKLATTTSIKNLAYSPFTSFITLLRCMLTIQLEKHHDIIQQSADYIFAKLGTDMEDSHNLGYFTSKLIKYLGTLK